MNLRDLFEEQDFELSEVLNEEELLEFLPLAIAGLGAAWTAYDAWQLKKAYDRGEISKADMAKQIGTDAAISLAGGALGKVASKGYKALKKAFGKAQGAADKAQDVKQVAPTQPAPKPQTTPTPATTVAKQADEIPTSTVAKKADDVDAPKKKQKDKDTKKKKDIPGISSPDQSYGSDLHSVVKQFGFQS